MKTTIEVVGNDRALDTELLYVVVKKNDQAKPNGLFRLQHPGNLELDSWNESVIKQEDGSFKVSSKERTKKFFDKCVLCVDDPKTEIEKELVSLYGENKIGKLNPDKIHPSEYGVWQKLQTRFFSGDIFDEIPEPREESNSQPNAEDSKGSRRK
jgi:hypothetical protein